MFQIIKNIFRVPELTQKVTELEERNKQLVQRNESLLIEKENEKNYYNNQCVALQEKKDKWEDQKKREDSDRDHKWKQEQETHAMELSKLKLNTEIECERMKTETAKECQAAIELNSGKINGFWERAVAFASNGSDKMLNRFMEFVMADKTVQSDFIIKAREAALLESGKTDDTVAAVIEDGKKKKK